MKVGFIGLGTMGRHMAANLQKAGHELVVFDVRKEAAEPHVKNGARLVDSPRAVAEATDVVFTSLPGPVEVESVALDEKQGLLAGLTAGKAFFDLSTNSPTVVRKIHAIFKARGVDMLDSPVSGGPRGAESGRLALWVGGDEAVFKKLKPVLDAIGDHPLAIFKAVRQGARGRVRTFDSLADNFLPGKFDPPSFALRLAHKDVTLACALGRENKVPMRLAHLTLEEMTEALNRGWGERDSRVPMLLQEERAGVEIKVDPAKLKEVLERDGK